mmetsp:Transcript_38645/g.124163  ORF Transcript_38645/g.124163 Transcript_38645/m.124163 type:complete len:174 (-) Transcript_38645:1112-1633(-)
MAAPAETMGEELPTRCEEAGTLCEGDGAGGEAARAVLGGSTAGGGVTAVQAVVGLRCLCEAEVAWDKSPRCCPPGDGGGAGFPALEFTGEATRLDLWDGDALPGGTCGGLSPDLQICGVFLGGTFSAAGTPPARSASAAGSSASKAFQHSSPDALSAALASASFERLDARRFF